jgi:alpha-L-arabinofuranosidase
MNTYLRHAGRVSICTGADFFGTRWTVNAVKIPVPGGSSYLFPIGTIMKLYKKHSGNKTVLVTGSPAGLDIAATRTDDRIFLHVLNTEYSDSVQADIRIEGYEIASAKAYEIAPSDRLAYVDDSSKDTFKPVEKVLGKTSEVIFPPASVSVIELQLKSE